MIEASTMEDLIESESPVKPVSADDIRKIIDSICENDERISWQRDVELNLETRKWRPHALSEDGAVLLYVCNGVTFPRFARERIALASSQGIRPVIALSIAALYREEILDVLADNDAYVMVLDDYVKERRYKHRHFLAALADIEIPVKVEVRQSVASKIWSIIETGTSDEKGRRLEALLAFLFSQVNGLKVAERNYRTETEEIDLVLQLDNLTNRVWQKSFPFLLVEAKNRKDKASQPMMSGLIGKLQTKRGSASIGILASLAGFTQDAKMHELRYSTEDLCVAMIDRADIKRLIESDVIDDELESHIRRALLR